MIKENKTLKDLSIQELKSKQKKLTTFVSIFSIVTMATLVALIYFAMKNNNYSFLTICGLSSFAMILYGFILRKVEIEINSRNQF